MKLPQWRFNIYLTVICLLLLTGCKTAEERKRDNAAATLMIYLESQSHDDGRSRSEQVFRANPVTVYFDRTAFLNTGNVEEAAVIDDWGGYHIMVRLDRRGGLLLESITASHVGKRMVIHAVWEAESRWLAAPMITTRISDGILRFLPDATREESELIVLGLNNVAEEVRKKDKKLLKNVWDKEEK